MKIFYLNDFINKLQLNRYPIKGYWIQFISSVDYDNDNIDELQESIVNFNSDTFITNTFLLEDKFRISFNLANTTISDYKGFCLYAVDGDISKDIPTKSWAGDDYLNNIAIIGLLNDSEPGFIDGINNIINIPFPDGKVPTCSFIGISKGKNSEVSDNQCSHYMSDFIGSVNLYSNELEEDSLIDKISGLDRIRETMTDFKANALNGSMTIKKSGVIQL